MNNLHKLTLTSSDASTIAQAVGCTPLIVRRVLTNDVHRPTFLHIKIIKMAQYRSQQNEALQTFCQSITVESIANNPKK